jgi:hypothetical protein
MTGGRSYGSLYLVDEGWPDGTLAFFHAFWACAYPFLKCRI